MTSLRLTLGVACAVACACLPACGGDSFEGTGTPTTEAGVDASYDGPAKNEGGHEAGKEAGKADAFVPDSPAEAMPQDAVAEPTCTPESREVVAEADGMILPEGTNCGASISSTTGACMDLNLGGSGSRLIIRFGLGPDDAQRVTSDSTLKATLELKLAKMLSECDSTAPGPAQNVAGPTEFYPLRSDWIEGGSYLGAQWCYRKGNGSAWSATDAWALPGASGDADRGLLAGSAILDTQASTFEAPLEVSTLGSWLSSENKLSILVAPAAASTVLAYVRTRESGAAPILRLTWCK